MASTSDLTVRGLQRDEWDAVLDLRARAFDGHDAARVQRRWVWQFETNPAAGSDPAGLVLERGGEAVGFFGQIPIRVSVYGRTIVTRTANDFFVDPSLHAMGAGLLLARPFLEARSDEDFPFATAPFPGSLDLWKYFGAAIIEGASEPCLWNANGPAEIHPTPGRTVRRVDAFPAEVDELFEHLRTRWPVLTVRDAAYLNWRYRDYPFAKAEMGLILADSGELRGFVVVQPDHGHGRAYLTELFTDPDDVESQSAGAQFAVESRDRLGFDEMYALHRETSIHRALSDAGFHEVHGHPLGFFAAPGPAAPSVDDWYLTAGDGDLLFTVDGA